MFQSEPQSPFLKYVPENQQTYFTKKVISMLQTDKENVLVEKPNISVDKMKIGENQVDGYLVDVGEVLRLKKDAVRDLFRGLEKENKSKRVIIGLLGHRPLPAQKTKNILQEKHAHTEKSSTLLNLNILLKLKPEEYPYVAMFTCDCLMSILKLYVQKTNYKKEDLRMRWKYDFFLEEDKIGEILVIHDHKGDDVFVNIAVRMKLSKITSDEHSFSCDLVQQFAGRLNISKNMRQSAIKIRQIYQSHLMYIGQQVLIKRRQPNQWEDIVGGKFIRVNEIGNAILEGVEGNEEQIQYGYMELRENVEDLGEEERLQEKKLEGIEI